MEATNLIFAPKSNSEEAIRCIKPATCTDFVESMRIIRQTCVQNGWVVLYHFTHPHLWPLIAKSGFRMSTQGQGDGGVYFSVKGPFSYGMGSNEYEENIIADCFGASRLDEYRGMHKLDVVFAYGMEVSALTQAPGGRDNAFMVSKTTFDHLALPDTNGDFFLRADRILGIFMVNPEQPPSGLNEAQGACESEQLNDQATKDLIVGALRARDLSDAATIRLLAKIQSTELLHDDVEFADTFRDQSIPLDKVASVSPTPAQQPMRQRSFGGKERTALNNETHEQLVQIQSESLRINPPPAPKDHDGSALKGGSGIST